MAHSGHIELHRTCPLLGVKRTWRFALQMSAYDPKRTLAKIGLRLSFVWCSLSRDTRFLRIKGALRCKANNFFDYDFN